MFYWRLYNSAYVRHVMAQELPFIYQPKVALGRTFPQLQASILLYLQMVPLSICGQWSKYLGAATCNLTKRKTWSVESRTGSFPSIVLFFLWYMHSYHNLFLILSNYISMQDLWVGNSMCIGVIITT